MIKILKQHFILIVCLFLYTNLYSQHKKTDPDMLYNYWAKQGTIEMVYASMQDFLKSVKDTSKTNLERKGFQEFKVKFIDSSDKKDLDKNFGILIQFLKENNWENTATKLVEPIVENYKNRKKIDEDFFINNSAPNKDNKNWDENKNRILDKYNSEIIWIKRNIWLGDHILWVIFICFFSGLILGGITIYLYTKLSIYSILSKEKNKYLNDLVGYQSKYWFNYIKLILVLKNSKDKKQSEIDRLKNEVSILKNSLNNENFVDKTKIVEQPNKILPPIDDTTVVEDKINNTVEWEIEQENLSHVIYFSIPESDGSFKAINGKQRKEMDCFYKIEVDKNSQKGKLFFLSGDFDLKALDNIDYYLNPVCEIENISDRTQAKKINVINYGSVVFNGEQWKIESNKKLIIRLI